MGTLELVVVWVVLDDPTNYPDMQKVEILPPADFQVKIYAKGQNQKLLLGFMNFPPIFLNLPLALLGC